MSMTFAGIEKFSTIDFPGKLACVLFTQGCNINCFYCHNPGLIKIQKKARLSQEEVLSFLRKRAHLLEGVVITGGEPTLQKELPDFLRAVKALGYSVKLDTNGTNPKMLKHLLAKKLADYVAMDVKTLPEQYPWMCGVEAFSKVLESYDKLKKSGVAFEFRTTLYPGLTIDELKKLFILFPHDIPLWRLNFFIMPQYCSENNYHKLHKPILDKAQLDKHKEELLALQQNITYPH